MMTVGYIAIFLKVRESKTKIANHSYGENDGGENNGKKDISTKVTSVFQFILTLA